MSGDLILVVRRTVKAPAARVYQAWTQPVHLRTWWGPRPVTCIDAEVDLRVGGRYRIANLLPDGAVLWIAGTFEVIEPDKKLVYSWQLERDGEPPREHSRVTVRFEPRAEGTEVIVAHEKIETDATRADHEKGWNGCLENLASMLD